MKTEKTLAQKLFLHKAQQAAVLHADGASAALLAAAAEAPAAAATEQADWLLVSARNRSELETWLPLARERMLPGAALWLAYYKASSRHAADIHRDSITAYAATLGLDSVAIIAVDDDWSCLRFKLLATKD